MNHEENPNNQEEITQEELEEQERQRGYDNCYKTHNLVKVKLGNFICCTCGNHFVKTQGGINVGPIPPSLKQKVCK
jgi:hypothetical protein